MWSSSPCISTSPTRSSSLWSVSSVWKLLCVVVSTLSTGRSWVCAGFVPALGSEGLSLPVGHILLPDWRLSLFTRVHSVHHFHHLDHQSLQAGGLPDGQCVCSPSLRWLCVICVVVTEMVSLYRGGGTCGWTTPSGVCSSPPFCWSSWCCCGPRLTARGQTPAGTRVFLFLKLGLNISASVPIPQVFSFSSNWRWRGRRG